MKKTLFILLVTSISAFSQIPTNGLVAYWPFDGDANDYSGNNNDGTVNGATLVSDRFGIANRAYSFNGTNNNIIVNNSTTVDVPNSGNFTFAFWIKTYSNNYYSIPVCKSVQNSTDGYEFAADNQNAGYCNSPGAFSFYTASGAQQDACANSAICDDYTNWYFITGTFNGSLNQTKLYVNAVAQSDIGQSSGNMSNTSTLVFGSTSSAGQYFSGALDGVRMYNRILTDNEITILYNEGNSSTGVNGVIAFYNDFSVFPNPASDALKLKFSSQSQHLANIMILDNVGKVVYNDTCLIAEGVNDVSIGFDHLKSGIYSLQMVSEKGQITRKISVMN